MWMYLETCFVVLSHCQYFESTVWKLHCHKFIYLSKKNLIVRRKTSKERSMCQSPIWRAAISGRDSSVFMLTLQGNKKNKIIK